MENPLSACEGILLFEKMIAGKGFFIGLYVYLRIHS